MKEIIAERDLAVCIEDDPDLRELFVFWLECTPGIKQVMDFRSGEKGWNCIQTYHPRIGVLHLDDDLHEEITGSQIAVKTRIQYQQIPVIVVSAYAMDEVAREILLDKFDFLGIKHLNKPFENEDLTMQYQLMVAAANIAEPLLVTS